MTVYLVGAGPGAAGLITVRGAEVLSRAEVVLFDRLVSREILRLAPAEAELVDVGKRPGQPGPLRQKEINQLLLAHAGVHETVVRLKGGDPFVFGRGGEEAEALIAAGFEVEVVPGVSSAFAVPASAGVPVTHRGVSRSVTVVTGHVEDDPRSAGHLDWGALASVGGTLVVMMGMERRKEIAERLIAAGLPAETPVLVVQDGTTPRERRVRCRLAALADVELSAPAIIVIGEVAALDLARRRKGPLAGLSVVVTRAADQAGPLVSAFRRRGAQVVLLPVIEITGVEGSEGPLNDAAEGLAAGEYEWVVFTSVNAVKRLLSKVRDLRRLAGVRIAAVGTSTAAALEQMGTVPDLVPNLKSGRGLAEAMPAAFESARGKSRVLFPRAEEADEGLPSGLRDKGWEVDEVVTYRTVAASGRQAPTTEELAAACDADVVTFASASAVRLFCEMTEPLAPRGVVACIGPSTAGAAGQAGLEVAIVAEEPTTDGLVDAVERYFQGR